MDLSIRKQFDIKNVIRKQKQKKMKKLTKQMNKTNNRRKIDNK